MSINNILPVNNDISFLGQLCTSIITHEDPDFEKFEDLLTPENLLTSVDLEKLNDPLNTLTLQDLLEQKKKSLIILFDGCQPCSGNCQTLLELYRQIRDMQLWLTAMKDIMLYNQQDCVKAYDNILLAKVGKEKRSEAMTACTNDTPLIRPSDHFKGLQLLYQYKSVVALWNYLADRRTFINNISTASEDYSGLNITCKKSINLCAATTQTSSTKILLRIDVYVQPGSQPLPKYTVQQTKQFQNNKTNYYCEYTIADSDTNADAKARGRFNFVLLCNASNTSMQLSSDSSNLLSESSGLVFDITEIQTQTFDAKVPNGGTTQSKSLGSITYTPKKVCFCWDQTQDQCKDQTQDQCKAQTASATVQFTFQSKRLTQLILSGSIKIIPIWLDDPSYTGYVSLAKYNDQRSYNTYIKLQEQSQTIDWHIEYKWIKVIKKSIEDKQTEVNQILWEDHLLYQTAYTRYPYTYKKATSKDSTCS